jgi:hypothetical protein
MINLKDCSPQQVLRGQCRGVPFKIVRWAFEKGKLRDDYPSGCWNFYLYFREKDCVNFNAIWLEDQATAYGRVTHDYYGCTLAHIDWHGDITWYEKQGHVEGFRCIEAGCDYQHHFDTDQHYSFESILPEVEQAIDSSYALGILKSDVLALT